MTPTELRAAIAILDLSQSAIADALGVAPQTFRRYLMEPSTPSALNVPKWMGYAIAGLKADLAASRRKPKPKSRLRAI